MCAVLPLLQGLWKKLGRCQHFIPQWGTAADCIRGSQRATHGDWFPQRASLTTAQAVSLRARSLHKNCTAEGVGVVKLLTVPRISYTACLKLMPHCSKVFSLQVLQVSRVNRTHYIVSEPEMQSRPQLAAFTVYGTFLDAIQATRFKQI